jgi:hypothetical protein
MIRERRWTLVPSRVVFVNAAVVFALALLGTLLIATAVETPAGTGVAVLALALALVVSVGSRHAIFAASDLALRCPRPAAQHLVHTGQITDPPRHPLRPRAPGPA